MEAIQSINWQSLLIVAAITTFLVSAINTIQSKISTNWLVFIVSILITLLNTTFVVGACFSDWQKLISEVLTTMAFAVLFYNYIGKWFVDQFFEWIKKTLTDRFNKPNAPQP